MSTGDPEPAPPDWEDEAAGREVHDGVEAAIAVLDGEPLVILRSDSADAQADKVNALRAALHGRPIRVLRLDGKHPRGLAPLAIPEPEADRAVLVVEHADTLDPATLDALRDVENLQLVLFHRADVRRPMWSGALEPASVRFPPGHLIAFELDPKRKRWRMLAMWALIAVAAGGVLVAGMLYLDLRGRSGDPATTVATAQDASPPQPATTPSVTAAPPASASAVTAEPAANPAPNPAPATSQSPSISPASAPTPPAVGPQTDASTAPADTPGASHDQAPSNASAPATAPAPPTAPATTDLARTPEPPAGEAPSASAPAGSQPSSHASERAQLKRDFDRFLAADRHLPKHLSRAQRRALFDKFLDWRASQGLNATR